ncbi:unnamed protein product, partial [Nesidiocoris tenuis]
APPGRGPHPRDGSVCRIVTETTIRILHVENVQPKSTHEHPVEAMLKLQYRKDMLENRLKEKCTELMQLCKKEYELTGVVPMEAPDDFGGSPPKIRRRIATMFPYDGELLKQLSQPVRFAGNLLPQTDPRHDEPCFSRHVLRWHALRRRCFDRNNGHRTASFPTNGSSGISSYKNACDLYHAGKKYILLHLERQCIEYLSEHLEKENAIQIYEFAQFHGEDELERNAVKINLQKRGEEGVYKENLMVKVGLAFKEDHFAEESLLRTVPYNSTAQVMLPYPPLLQPGVQYAVHVFLCSPGVYPLGNHTTLTCKHTNLELEFVSHASWEQCHPWNTTVLSSLIFTDVVETDDAKVNADE